MRLTWKTQVLGILLFTEHLLYARPQVNSSNYKQVREMSPFDRHGPGEEGS